MTQRAQDLLTAALDLSVEERADLASRLLASLDGAPAADLEEVERLWIREAERRAREVEDGSVVCEDFSEVQRRIETRTGQP